MRSMIIDLTSLDGRPVGVNADAINFIQPSDENTLIRFHAGEHVVVRQSYDEVRDILRGNARAPARPEAPDDPIYREERGLG